MDNCLEPHNQLQDEAKNYDDNAEPVKKRWTNQPKSYSCQKTSRFISMNEPYEVAVEINDEFLGVDDVAGLKTTLFPHQKPIVQAMIDAEKARKTIITATGGRGNLSENLTVINSSCVLSEPVGSGKTINILSLILKQKFPKAYPDVGITDFTETESSQMFGVVRKKYKNILFPTIIFVGVSVVSQWVQAITKFTNLRFFVVYQVKDLQILIEMIVSKKINNYDIVIAKNGKVTRPIKFPNCVMVEMKNLKSAPSIYNVIANMRNFCWARVVIDDFDTIKLSSNAGLVNGLFTWYISSTKKFMANSKPKNIQFRTTEDMLMHSDFRCGKIMENKILFKCLNIRNNTEFIERTNNLPSPNFFVYVFKNSNDKYMELMNIMDNEQVSRIMEMLNGDAFETAAETAGIKSTSVADIFQKILGEQFENYETSIKVIEFINKNEDSKKRIAYSACDDPEDTYTKKNLLEYRKPIYNYPGLRVLLSSTKEEYEEIQKTSGVAIQRVKSNIEQGTCPICYIEFSDADEDTVILKCCGVVVCSACCFETIFPRKRMNGQCSNCRNLINILNIIYMNSEFNLESIMKDRMQDDFSDNANSTEEKEPYKLPRSKIDAIVDIINGVVPEEQKSADIRMHNLMKGRGELPNSSIQKVLIFANFDETLKQIETDLTKRKIKFIRLSGGYNEIKKISKKFTKSKESCVMIINSTRHCSGLNLQAANHLIFAHKILDKNVQSQVAGRIQRMGRLTQANIHFMLYQNEFDSMEYSDEIRIL
jgi:SNF2 family DNA or RNA helicase